LASALAAVAAAEHPLVFVSGYDNTVTCFDFDPATGDMKQLSQSDCGKNPTYLAIHPSHKYLFAGNETGPGKVSAYAIAAADGKLTRINEASSGGNGPAHLAAHPDGKWVFTGNYGSGHVGVLPVKDDGSVGEPVEALLGGKNAHQTVVDPTGKFLFVPFLGSDYVAQYLIDEATGKLTPNTPPTAATEVKAGPRHIAFSPDAKHAYVIDELNMTMTSFDYDAAKGLLANPEVVSTLPAGETKQKGQSTAHVVVSPDGKFVYGSNRGHNTIVIYAVDAATGRLKLLGHESGGKEIDTPRDFTLDPSGNFVIVASQGKDYITVFKRDVGTGLLTKLAQHKVAPKPSFVGFMTR
jgi:6-phosphogluconolactonase